jgi:hypothetical protein
MKIVELELKHYNFYCPATGLWITSENDVNHDAPSLLGYWLDEFWREPFIKDESLKKKWESYMVNFEVLENSPEFVNQFASLEDFFKNLNFNNVVVFKIIDNLPDSRTPYFMLNLNTKLLDTQ